MAEREFCELLQLVQSEGSACLFNGSYWTYPEECCRGGMDSILREEKQIQSGTQRKGIVISQPASKNQLALSSMPYL